MYQHILLPIVDLKFCKESDDLKNKDLQNKEVLIKNDPQVTCLRHGRNHGVPNRQQGNKVSWFVARWEMNNIGLVMLQESFFNISQDWISGDIWHYSCFFHNTETQKPYLFYKITSVLQQKCVFVLKKNENDVKCFSVLRENNTCPIRSRVRHLIFYNAGWNPCRIRWRYLPWSTRHHRNLLTLCHLIHWCTVSIDM